MGRAIAPIYHARDVEAAIHKVSLTVAPEHARLRVDAFLAQVLPWRSRRSLAELLAAGAVAVNGHRVKKAHRVAAGDDGDRRP